jgi:hypothetical protein
MDAREGGKMRAGISQVLGCNAKEVQLFTPYL